MKMRYLLPFAMVLCGVAAPAQDWQHFKPEGSYSFAEVKASVRSVTTTHFYTGWDEKEFNRSGDLVSVAILQSLSGQEMASPETLDEVLSMLRAAFACVSRCVAVPSDRQPRVTSLLLEHLRRNAPKKMQAKIDEARTYVTQQAANVE